MKNAFDANVPRSRPRPRRKSTILTAMEEVTPTGKEPGETRPEASLKPAPAASVTTDPSGADRLVAHMKQRKQKAKAKARGAEERRPLEQPVVPEVLGQVESRSHRANSLPGADTRVAGKDRVAKLKQRLQTIGGRGDRVAQPPAQTAEVAKQFVTDLQERLDAAALEREVLQADLVRIREERDDLRTRLAEKEGALEQVRSDLSERESLMTDLMAEAEALAAERDQAFSRIVELKALDEQQTRLLQEVESTLEGRQQELEQAFDLQRDLKQQLAGRSEELARRAADLAGRTAERDELQVRIGHLETELQDLGASREALSQIRRLVDATN